MESNQDHMNVNLQISERHFIFVYIIRNDGQ